jgi:hypothetical protein
MIDITDSIPLGTDLTDAKKFAKEVSFSLRCLWAAEGGSLKISPADFALNIQITTKVRCFQNDEAVKKNIEKIFNTKILKKITNEKIDLVVFNFNGQQIQEHFN